MSKFYLPACRPTVLTSEISIIFYHNLVRIQPKFGWTWSLIGLQSVFDRIMVENGRNHDARGHIIGVYNFERFQSESDWDPTDIDPLKFIDILGYSFAFNGNARGGGGVHGHAGTDAQYKIFFSLFLYI